MTSAEEHRQRFDLPKDCPVHSPWGTVQTGEKLAEGVFSVSTPGHGGIKLDRKRNGEIPEIFRREGGWYEEDCDWAIPVYILGLMPDKNDAALKMLRDWHWRAYEAWFHVTILPGESFLKDEYLFAQANANDWVVISACGDWYQGVPKGMVGCIATKGGVRGDGRSQPESRRFLVPVEEYQTRGRHGFVIDESKHKEWPQ